MTQARRIAKNILAGGISTAAGGLLRPAAVLPIARQISVAQFGLDSFKCREAAGCGGQDTSRE